jgi:hypothetical protein
VEAIAEELKLERPSAAMRIRLLEWVKQIEEAAVRQAERRANSSG